MIFKFFLNYENEIIFINKKAYITALYIKNGYIGTNIYET